MSHLTTIKTHVWCTFLRWPLRLIVPMGIFALLVGSTENCLHIQWENRKAERFIHGHVWWRKKCLPCRPRACEPCQPRSERWFMLMWRVIQMKLHYTTQNVGRIYSFNWNLTPQSLPGEGKPRACTGRDIIKHTRLDKFLVIFSLAFA